MCGEIGASGCHTSTQVGLAMSRPPLINPCQLDLLKPYSLANPAKALERVPRSMHKTLFSRYPSSLLTHLFSRYEFQISRK